MVSLDPYSVQSVIQMGMATYYLAILVVCIGIYKCVAAELVDVKSVAVGVLAFAAVICIAFVDIRIGMVMLLNGMLLTVAAYEAPVVVREALQW